MSFRLSTFVLAALVLVAGCRPGGGAPASAQTPTSQPSEEGTQLAPPPPEGMAAAIFAGGCFWCMEGPFEHLDGVREVLAGYTGGSVAHPTYHEVGSGTTGHCEAVYVVYDPSVVSYDTLLDTYWRSMDPTDAGGQFADRGNQYRPDIFVFNEAQRAAAEASKAALQASGRFDAPIVVPIEDAGDFWVAEDYHQDYYRTHPERYQSYREASGRAGFLRRIWGDQAH